MNRNNYDRSEKILLSFKVPLEVEEVQRAIEESNGWVALGVTKGKIQFMQNELGYSKEQILKILMKEEDLNKKEAEEMFEKFGK